VASNKNIKHSSLTSNLTSKVNSVSSCLNRSDISCSNNASWKVDSPFNEIEKIKSNFNIENLCHYNNYCEYKMNENIIGLCIYCKHFEKPNIPELIKQQKIEKKLNTI
jgi:hypothetical protein